MGGDFDAIIKPILTAAAKCGLQVLYEEVPPVEEGSLFAEDVLTRIPFNPGDRHNMYTGEEFFDMFMKPFLKSTHGVYGVAVASIDDATNVPAEKEYVQQLRRVVASKTAESKAKKGVVVQSFLNGARFCDGGVYYPGQNQKEEHAVDFDVRALIHAKHTVKSALWDYFLKKIRGCTFPDGRRFFFEYKASGPFVFDGSKPGVQDATHAHNHGETDPSMSYWLQKIAFASTDKHLPAVIHSKDQDVALLIVDAIEHELQTNRDAPASRLRPIYWKKSKGEVLDMRVFHKLITRRNGGLNMTINAWLLMCISCGTDYFRKDLVFNGFGADKVLKLFQQLCDADKEAEERKVDNPMSLTPFNEYNVEALDSSRRKSFEHMVRYHYTNFIEQRIDGKMAVVQNKNNRTLFGLSVDRKALSHQRLCELFTERIKKTAMEKARKVERDARTGKPAPKVSTRKPVAPVNIPSIENIMKGYQLAMFHLKYIKKQRLVIPAAAAAAEAVAPELGKRKREDEHNYEDKENNHDEEEDVAEIKRQRVPSAADALKNLQEYMGAN
jgi:hypothetical protein